jgi:TPR repeat protein
MRISMVILAFAVLSGCATPQMQFQQVKSAAVRGDHNAQYATGRMYHAGYGVPRDYAEAANWYRQAADSGHARAAASLAGMYERGEGVPQDYAEALRLLEGGTAGGDVTCLACLSWLLATCPDDRIRNGERAVSLAQRLVSIDSQPGNMDTLAAAYAAAGRFEDAVRTQNEAIEKLQAQKDYRTETLVAMRNHLAAYQDHKPWLDPQH